MGDELSTGLSTGGAPLAVAVVGPGRMGLGIAEACALAGSDVAIVDVKPRSREERRRTLDRAEAKLRAELALWRETGWASAGRVEAAAARIRFCDEDGDAAVAAADVAFEAVPERLEIKEQALRTVSELLGDAALLASTTSALSAAELARACARPERFVVTHWLNPAAVMPLVEVSAPAGTDADAVERTCALLRAAGKVPVRCDGGPGHVIARIQVVALNEAWRLLEEGVATAEEIDVACRLGLGVRFASMGMLHFTDLGGPEILEQVGGYLERTVGGGRFAPPAIVGQRAGAGRILARADPDAHDVEALRRLVQVVRAASAVPA